MKLNNKRFIACFVSIAVFTTLVITLSLYKKGDSEKTQLQEETSVTELHLVVMGNQDLDLSYSPIIRGIEEALNVKLKYTIIPEYNYMEQIKVILEGDEKVDLVMFPSHQNQVFLEAVQRGKIISLDKYLDETSPIVKYTLPSTLDLMKVTSDGGIYAVPRSTLIRNDGYIIRKDWCEALNIPIPTDSRVSYEELYEMMKKFTYEDPDKNGKRDTYGYTTSMDKDGYMNIPFMDVYHVDGWREVTGEKYKYMNTQYARNNLPLKKTLELNANLFKEGILDYSSPFLYSEEEVTQRFLSGRTGVIRESPTNVYTYKEKLKKDNPLADVTYVFLENEQGEVKGCSFETGYWWISAVTKQAEKAGKAGKVIQVLNYMLSDEGWNLYKYGSTQQCFKQEGSERIFDANAYQNVLDTRSTLALVRRYNDPELFINARDLEAYRENVKKWLDLAVTSSQPSLDRGYVPSIARNQTLAYYDDKLKEMMTRIILGEESVEAYDTALEDWYEVGGEDYVREMNAFISSKHKEESSKSK